MRKINLPLCILVVFLCASSCDAQPSQLTTFILLRHSEKADDGTQDPDLKPEGNERAQKIATMLKDTPITAIYSTNYKRTKNTVQPVAALANVDVKVYEAFKPDVLKTMVNEHRGGTILISGHSNTTPWTANLLLGKQVYKDYAESEYGIMLIVTVSEMGKVGSVVRLNY